MLLATALGRVEAAAQAAEVPGAMAIGPLTIRPQVTLANIGIDDNVFNQPTNPQSDFVFTLAPSVDVSLRIRRATIDATTAASYLHFERARGERSLNPSQSVRLEVPLNRLTFRAAYAVASTRERPGLEVDLRARRRIDTITAAVDLRLSPRTTVRVEGAETITDYRSTTVGNVNLRMMLNRRGRDTRLSVRHAVTPLTTLVFSGERVEDRFTLAPERDADGFRLMPGVEFNRFALIAGSAAVGWRTLRPSSPVVPEYSGVAARVQLSSTIRDSLRVTGGYDRDITYSFQPAFPYYLQTTMSLSATQRLGERWDLVGAAGTQRLAYQQMAALLGPDLGSVTDMMTGTTLGGSLGYFVRPGLRVSINAQRARRHGGPVVGQFTRWQYGSSITYGL
ncbi:MAG: outer membrane beta-barrel protein [Acidobacteria bacterium]|nr:outer membrane beta-barrel protein [Acidobacteriota bacterium]